MKSTHTEVKFLRAEVRALRAQVAQLETLLTLQEIEQQAQEDAEFRCLWPYSWILSGLEVARQGWDCLHATSKRPDWDSQPNPHRPKKPSQKGEGGVLRAA